MVTILDTKAVCSFHNEYCQILSFKNEQVQRTVNVTQEEIPAKKANELKVIKVPKSENGSKPKHQYLKDERPVSTKEKGSQLPSLAKLEQKELMQSKKVVINLSYHIRTRNPPDQPLPSSWMFIDLRKRKLESLFYTIIQGIPWYYFPW